MKQDKIPTFSDEVKQQIIEMQNEFCKALNCYEKIHSVHHKLPNNKSNRAKYPLFIHSPMNGVGLCNKHHSDYAHLFKITEKEAECYESYLQNIKNWKDVIDDE